MGLSGLFLSGPGGGMYLSPAQTDPEAKGVPSFPAGVLGTVA